jgi:hypothetical protein
MKVEWIINDEMTVADLLNPLWTSHLYEVAPAFTYPLRWVLVDNRMGTVFDQMGQRWAEAYSMDSDNRSLAEVGIHPGMELAVKISETDHPSRRRRLQPSQRSEHVSYT